MRRDDERFGKRVPRFELCPINARFSVLLVFRMLLALATLVLRPCARLMVVTMRPFRHAVTPRPLVSLREATLRFFSTFTTRDVQNASQGSSSIRELKPGGSQNWGRSSP